MNGLLDPSKAMPLPIGSVMPSLDRATEWIGGCFDDEASSGRPTLVQFWAISCPICKRNMPSVLEFVDKYHDQHLRLLSIHMPRIENDQDISGVRVAMAEMSLFGPCAIDNSHAIGKAFQTGRIWPSYFLFDGMGRLRSRAAGQLGLKMAENSLKRLLAPELAEI